MRFIDRVDAGRQLAARLREFHGEGVVVLAIPRGGVPVAFEVAKALGAPLDIIMARKVGVQGTERGAREEVERRARHYRAGRCRVPLDGKTVIVVDEGIATGSTARAACLMARAHGARHVIMAAPVGPSGCEEILNAEADAVVCLTTRERIFAIAPFYDDDCETSDLQAVQLLEQAASRFAAPVARANTIELDDPNANVPSFDERRGHQSIAR